MSDVTVVESTLITVEVLKDGGSSEVIALPDKYRFSSTSARDAYFAYYPSELVSRLWVLVDSKLYQYFNNKWQEYTNIITGPSGKAFTVVNKLDSEDDLPSADTAPANEAYLVGGFDNGDHLFIIYSELNKWVDQGPFTGITGPKGDPGPTPTFSISGDGHLLATYED